MAGSFTTGGDVVDGVLAQSGFSTVTTTENYSLGTRRIQKADEVKSNLTTSTASTNTLSGTDEAGMGNSGVDRNENFSLLDGDRHWIYIKCAGVDIKAGDVVERDSGAPFTGRPVDSNTVLKPKLLGVADNAIPVGSYGWVITKGCAVVRTDTSGGGKSVAANALIDTDGAAGAGEVNTAAGSDLSVIGVTLEAASATLADFAQCYIDIS
tara:strand:+ start:205 stop:834 length:630 start_codon:yes stop_codon:yes gene_type:complete